jgi:hypothetical protein
MQLALTALKQIAFHKLERTPTRERWINPNLTSIKKIGLDPPQPEQVVCFNLRAKKREHLNFSGDGYLWYTTVVVSRQKN